MIFATPDFGASGAIVLCLLLAWAIVLVLVAVGIACGLRLLKNGSARARTWGGLLVLLSGLVPLSCCLLPPHAVRIAYGNYPLGSYPSNKIQEGMTKKEVLAILGPPHERFEEHDGESWYYWIDSFDISYFAVRFGPDGRVTGTHGN
jgi:hypothetical protein